MLTRTTPILATRDVVSTVAFYKDVLGFDSGWVWGDPVTFGGASMGGVSLMFSLDAELASKVEGHPLWIDAEDVDRLYSTHLERGAAIVSPLENKPWNRREYTVRDPNGYHLRIGGRIPHESQGSAGFPVGVRIEPRLPTPDEFERVTEAAFGRGATDPEALRRSWAGVVAMGPEGEAVGVLRIMHDATGWYSAWDVAVLPEWQGKKIGSEMMKRAIELVRAESPGAWLFLFTYKNEFYERLGFTKESLHMRRV